MSELEFFKELVRIYLDATSLGTFRLSFPIDPGDKKVALIAYWNWRYQK